MMHGSRSRNTRRAFVGMLAVLVLTAGSAAFAAPQEIVTPPTWSVTDTTHIGTLYGVSCRSAKHCVAVGQADGIHALIRTWNGTTWSSTAHPLHGTTNAFAGVSCATANRCMAVGSQYVRGELRPLAEIWNGKHWTFTFSPIPISYLLGVSCPTANTCVAVGDYTEENVAAHAAAQLWTRDHWSTIAPPKLPPGWNARLQGVSCVSEVYCVAVGTITPPSGATQALIETWDGARWSISPGVAPSEHGRELRSVSCTNTTHCVAVGWSGAKSGRDPALITTWDGNRWSIAASRSYRIHDSMNGLYSVTCVSPTSCVAVGSATRLDTVDYSARPIIERWNGERWSLIAPDTGAHGAGAYSALLAASCAPGYCATTGYTYDPVTYLRTLTITGAIPSRSVTVSWTPAESRRLSQIAAYLHQSPEQAQKTVVFTTAYLIGLQPRTRPRLGLSFPPMGSAATYTNVWKPSELAIIDAVRWRFRVGSVGATRASVHLFSYLLALRGQ